MRTAPVLLFTAFTGIAFAQAADPALSTPYAESSFAEPARTEQGWSSQSRWTRQASADRQTIALRLRQRANAANERRAADHAANFSRCRSALQVVALCGTSAPAFSCGDQGFVPAPLTDTPAPAVSSGRKYHMQRCALQAKKGGP